MHVKCLSHSNHSINLSYCDAEPNSVCQVPGLHCRHMRKNWNSRAPSPVNYVIQMTEKSKCT